MACSTAHSALARLIHRGLVVHIISLNWDMLLEAALTRQYGIDLNTETIRLCKPHGDCRQPDEYESCPMSWGGFLMNSSSG